MAALLFGGEASAQSRSQTQADTPPAGSTGSNGSGDQPATGAGSPANAGTAPAQAPDATDDIVVTAQRRAELVSRAPLAITAIGGEQLQRQGITDANRLQDTIPSLHVQDRGSGTNIAIRGVVTVNPNPQGDPAVALSIDDIYVARPNAANSDFLDVQRIEVLRGPQGTVYGRNATGGAINVISNAPVFRTEGSLSAELGNYDEHHVTGVLNVPLSGTVAIRGAIDYNSHDGYIDHHFDDKDDLSSRLRLLWQADDRLSVLFTGFYNHRGGNGPADVLYPYVDPGNPRYDSNYPNDFGKRDSDYYGGSAKVSLDLNAVSLTYIGGYTVYDETSNIAQLGSLSTAHYDARQMTHELRLSSSRSAVKRGDFSWVAGLYYFQELQGYNNVIRQPLVPKTYAPILLTSATDEPHIDARSYAAFAQGTYSLLDTVRLTGGLRYTIDDKSQDGAQTLTIGRNPPVILVATGSRTFHNLSYRAAIEVDVKPNVLGYASITSGYHAGALTEGPPGFNSYNSEKVVSYEAGLRSRFVGDRLRLNATGYFYDYSDYQSQQIRPPFFPTPFNARKAHIYGAEGEGTFRFTPNDQLGFTVAYEDAKFVDFEVPASVFTGNAALLDASRGVYVYDGFSFPFVSRWSGTGSYSHTVALHDGGSVRADFTAGWRTGFLGYLDPSPLAHIDGWISGDASLTYAPGGRRFEISGYVRNLADALRPTQSAIIMGKAYRSFEPPRTYGVRGTVRF